MSEGPEECDGTGLDPGDVVAIELTATQDPIAELRARLDAGKVSPEDAAGLAFAPEAIDAAARLNDLAYQVLLGTLRKAKINVRDWAGSVKRRRTEISASAARPSPVRAGFKLTDLGNAERLVYRHGRDLRHCTGLGWLAWDGARWKRDETGEVMRRAKATVRRMYGEAGATGDPGARAALAKHAAESEQASRLAAIVKLAETETQIAITTEALDADPWAFNVANGTIDLRTGVILPHRREALITKLSPVTFDPTATCTTFDRFLAEAQPDPEVRAYLQRLVGYALTGVIREHVLPIFHGVGCNGKSTFVTVLFELFGDFGAPVPTELLMVKRGEAHPTERASLLGKRFVAATETEENRSLNVALVKLLTGGDAITARHMREDFFTFMPTHKIVLSTNHRPIIRETKNAIWRRVQLVPWAVSFDGREDTKLGEKLTAELPGILRWAVEGCLAWQGAGLAPPAIVQVASRDYQAEMDTLGDFFAERCIFEPEGRVSRPKLREAYEAWAKENGERVPLGPKAFAEQVRERGAQDIGSMREMGRTTPVAGWRGLRLRTGQDQIPEDEF